MKSKLMLPLIAASAIGGYGFYQQGNPQAKNQDYRQISPNQVQALMQEAIVPPETPVVFEMGNLSEVIRFDINPEWVRSRWPRVSTVPSDSGLSGMRVALVSGTRSADLLGSLTYFFDRKSRVQRIQFQGKTDDPSSIISLMTRAYGFKQRGSSGPGLYTLKDFGRYRGFLDLRYTTIIQANQSGKILVAMECLSPTSSYSLSPAGLQYLASLQ